MPRVDWSQLEKPRRVVEVKPLFTAEEVARLTPQVDWDAVVAARFRAPAGKVNGRGPYYAEETT